MRIRRPGSWLVVGGGLLVLAGCEPAFDAVGHLRIAEKSTRPLATATRGLTPEDDETSFLVQWDADAPGAGGYAESVSGGGLGRVFFAEDWWDGTHNKTNAAYLDSAIVMNWPVDASDDPLTAGKRYSVRARFDENAGAWTARTVAKTDRDLERGVVRVRIVLEEQVSERPGWSEVVDEAIRRWQDEIFAGLGLTLETETVVRTLRARIAPPGFGDEPMYRELSSDRDETWIDLVVVRDLEGGAGIYGVAGGIPGPVGSTGRSAVTVSMLTSAGPDGEFNDVELNILSETMAHEVGHYLGLFHPVEIPSGDATESFDALDDTTECASFEACSNILANNLMFPTPVCLFGDPSTDEDPGCIRQVALTDDQVGLIQRYVLVE